MTIPIIRPESVTPDWLSAVLAHGGCMARVRDFTAARVGTGQIGDSVRFTLDYADRDERAPATLVGKFPSPHEDSRQAGITLGNYIREVHFYNQLADSARICVPKTYFAAVDEASSEFVLMMEDLAPAEQGDQMKGVTLDQARTVLGEAAKLHASHWDDAAIDEMPWVNFTTAAPGNATPSDTVQQLWQGFRERYGSRVDAECTEIGNAFSARHESYQFGYRGPRCLTHNDYRPDNMMFASARGGYPVAVVDWQSLGLGCGAVDVSYFLGGALLRDVRRAEEEKLLAFYLGELKAQGVADYSLEQLRHDYARHSFQLFFTAFFAAMLVQQTERGDVMFFTMLRRAADQIIDWNALSLL